MPRGRPRGSSAMANKPRGRMTAYAFFVQTCRDEHKKLHPKEAVEFTEFSKQCSERWQTMSDIEKEKFHELASKDKIRYDEQMRNYVPSPSLVPGGRRRARRPRGSKKARDPNKPKRAQSAFFFYANEERPSVRAANPDFSVGEVAKELGRQWNELGDDVKMKFEKSAESDRARYDREMTDYRAGLGIVPPPSKKVKLQVAASNGHATNNISNNISNNLSEDDDVGDDDEEDDGGGDVSD